MGIYMIPKSWLLGTINKLTTRTMRMYPSMNVS